MEDAGIKLSSVASDIVGVSGRLMVQALILGQTDPPVLADLAKRRLRSKIPALTEALTGRFTAHHAFLAGVHLDLIDRHTTAINDITAGHLASWAGTTPGLNESAGRVKSTKTRPGNPSLQGALDAAAMSCSQNPGSYLGARYRRIASRRGPMKANVAIQHSMLIAIWHLGRTGTLYNDPGAGFFTRLHPERAKNRALHQLEAMGYHVTPGRAG